LPDTTTPCLCRAWRLRLLTRYRPISGRTRQSRAAPPQYPNPQPACFTKPSLFAWQTSLVSPLWHHALPVQGVAPFTPCKDPAWLPSST